MYTRVLICIVAMLIGCSEPEAEAPPRLELTLEGGPEDPAARLEILAERHASHADPEDEIGPLTGTLTQGQVQDHPVVLIGTRCYIAIGSGGEGVEDLDVSLINQNGVPIAQDADASRDAIIGVRQPICPYQPTPHRLRVRMFRGEGDYAVRLYHASSI